MTVVYTKPNCPACTATIRHLEKRGIAYDTEPINDDVLKQAAAAGIASAPIVLVEGKAVWGGYRPDAIDRLAA
jgi:glutaredoxin-like protein NrdH